MEQSYTRRLLALAPEIKAAGYYAHVPVSDVVERVERDGGKLVTSVSREPRFIRSNKDTPFLIISLRYY
jgi:hypothetical protein